ncbi:MATE efflux family protein 5-like isoform X1 [Tripterygium wilfordii]|uniref:MATE efflux family protein 5-like isoform X1 n=1 Tax=Tripterygium wilfordii TaxID=458696 RepID=A0A7J7C1I8_TRIWF|nr:MATE efflux family protein 5-like isoform X1 [Tripterygium wilfordii]
MRDSENIEKGLLVREGEEEDRGLLTWVVLMEEVKRVGYIGGPMVAVNFSQYFLQVISIMMVGHLGELALSSTAITFSICGVTGYSLVPAVPFNTPYDRRWTRWCSKYKSLERTGSRESKESSYGCHCSDVSYSGTVYDIKLNSVRQQACFRLCF